MTIVKITPLRYKKEYFTVVTNDNQSFRLHKEIMNQYHLEAGMDISEEKISEIKFVGGKRQATEYAYLFLSYRSRTEREMTQRLKRKGFAADVVDAVIHDLKNQNLINDLETAKSIAGAKITKQLLGRSRIHRELIQKGIEPEIAEEVVQQTETEMQGEHGNEEERAYRLLLKRKEQLKSVDAHTLHRRLFGYLSRRGFSFDVIEKVLSRYKRELNFGKERD